MGLINFLKGVDIDKQRKQLFIDPFDKGSKTTVYNIGRNGSATILKVEDPKNVMLEKGIKTYTANGITYDIPTLEKKLGDTVDHFTFFVFDIVNGHLLETKIKGMKIRCSQISVVCSRFYTIASYSRNEFDDYLCIRNAHFVYSHFVQFIVSSYQSLAMHVHFEIH